MIFFYFFRAHKEQKKIAETKVPEGPGVCFVCSESVEDLVAHMAEKHKVKIFSIWLENMNYYVTIVSNPKRNISHKGVFR
jgi:hypothetical protein